MKFVAFRARTSRKLRRRDKPLRKPTGSIKRNAIDKLVVKNL